MARLRGDKRTLDLLNWKPAEPKIERYAEELVRAATLGSKVSKAVAQSLHDARVREENPLDREHVAEAMSAYLGDDVPKNTLDAYASQARETHNISVIRAMALMNATSDFRLLGMIAEELGLTVIPRKYEYAVREAILAEQMDELKEELNGLRRRRK